MADLLEEICTFLAAAGLSLTATTNLFANVLLDDPLVPTECVAVYEYSGESPQDTFQSTEAAWENPHFQILVRSGDGIAARDLSVAISKKLHAVVNQSLSGTQYLRIQMIQKPFFLQRDNHGPTRRFIYACNYKCMRVPS